jgi:tetratricopeptide (TPR) repeat protein
MATEKHWASKQTSKQDEVRDVFVRGLDWAMTRRREVAMGAAGAAVAGILIGLFFYSRTARQNEAWDKLAMAEAYSYYGRPQEAATTLNEVAEQTLNPAAAGLAGMMSGDIKQAKGEHDAAVADYSRASENAPEPLKPFAFAHKISALEAAGKPAECMAAASSFLEANSDHFLGPQVQETLARCQLAAGQPEAAKATWQKISLQYPDTPWAARANARLQPPTK